MKKSNKMIKIIFLIMLLITMIFFMTNVVQASDEVTENIKIGYAIDFDPDEWKPNDDQQITEGQETTGAIGANRLMSIGNSIIGIIQIVGSFTSVIVLIIIGIRYMMGSVEERAEYKKAMTPYIIGAVMVFAITNILSIVVGIVQEGGLA